jgi:CMP-N,N'-diacetyllegionaminic acid synthase
MEILGIIPARGGSKGVPFKNIKKLNGIPLIGHTINSALKSKKINRLIVSTDNIKIKNTALKLGAEVPFLRPKVYATSKSQNTDVIRHTISFLKKTENYEPDIIIYLQPTTPFRTTKQIDKSINSLIKSKATCVVGVSKIKTHPYRVFWPKNEFLKPARSDFLNFYQRQMFPVCYYPTGSIYTFWKNTFEKHGNIYGPKIKPLILKSDELNIDIDSFTDFFICEMLMKNKISKK